MRWEKADLKILARSSRISNLVPRSFAIRAHPSSVIGDLTILPQMNLSALRYYKSGYMASWLHGRDCGSVLCRRSGARCCLASVFLSVTRFNDFEDYFEDSGSVRSAPRLLALTGMFMEDQLTLEKAQ